MVHTKSLVPEKLESFRALIKPGVTTRAEAHERLGKPILRSDKRSIEVYRAAKGQDAEIGIVGIFPAFIDTDDVIIYTMLLYDKNDVVIEADWDVFTEARGAAISIGELRFMSIGSETGIFSSIPDEYIFIRSPASRKDLYRAAPLGDCLISIKQDDRTKKIFIDGKLVLKEPDFEILSGFVQVPIKPGRHTLLMKLRLIGTWAPREYSLDFSCESGDLLYAYLDIEEVPTGKAGMFSDKYKYEGEIRVINEPSDKFLHLIRILYRSGNWLDN